MATGSRAEELPLRLQRSLFDVPPDFFDSCRILSHSREIHAPTLPSVSVATVTEPFLDGDDGQGVGERKDQRGGATRWTCNTCKAEFESLLDQRSHFKSDLHRLNVKLNLAGKDTIKEEDLDEVGGVSLFEDGDISSISGSEDEVENESQPNKGLVAKEREVSKKKIYMHLRTGDVVSLWRCLILKEHEVLSSESKSKLMENDSCEPCVSDEELVYRLEHMIHEPRDKTHLRIIFLVCGGHFAGCVFDGNTVVAHKTFHRYVVRAKAGKKQSAKDATGKAASSAGSSLRRYNEAALKKEVQDLLATWKPFFAASSCILIHAPSKNHQLLFDGEHSNLSSYGYAIRNVPLSVRRPTLKEAKRVFSLLTHITYATNEELCSSREEQVLQSVDTQNHTQEPGRDLRSITAKAKEITSVAYSNSVSSEIDQVTASSDSNVDTSLHEAAKSGDALRTLELLEQGSDPCIKDSRGRTPYMLANEKEVRNTFRRFMAFNLEKWDWNAANVPCPLTKEMEESQAAKQAEKDAKRKAKAKELKKLRKAKEKAQSEAVLSQNAAAASKVLESKSVPVVRGQLDRIRGLVLSKEEQRKIELDIEREKRASAAERRIAAFNVLPTSQATPPPPGIPETKASTSGGIDDTICSCCNSSLSGKVPFHRYHYKYCSTSCMHVHREILEDG